MKVVTTNLASIALEKRFLIDELELTEYFSFFDNKLEDELRGMCNAFIGGKRTGGRLKTLIFDDIVRLHAKTVGFKDCITLEKVSLKLGSNSDILPMHFSGCKSLKCIELRFPDGNYNKSYYTKDGVLYSIAGCNKSRLVKYPANKGTEFTLPKDVIAISDLAFEDCQLTTLIISNPIPATCKEEAFKGVNPVTLIIKVPKDSYESFWVHPVYGKFRIEEMEE